MDTEVIIGLLILSGCAMWSTYVLREKIQEEIKDPKPKNYKNISQMAQNLSVCSVETRGQVLIELQEDSEWTEEELEDLKGVLGGMLRKKVSVNEDAGKEVGLKIKYAERD